jgi:hypothetical protein
VPESTNIRAVDGFGAIKTLATSNKMIINFSRTKEIVFHRPNPHMDLDTPSAAYSMN